MNWFKKSLSRKLIISSISVALIVFVCLGAVIGLQVHKQLTEQAKSELSYEAENIAGELNTFFDKNGTIVEQMALNPDFTDFVNAIKTRQDKFDHPEFKKIAGQMGAIENTDPNISIAWLGIVESSDLVLSNTDYQSKPDFEITGRPWFTQMIEEDGLTYTPPYFDAITDALVITIAYPLKVGDKVVGNTAMDLTISEIGSYLASFEIGESGYCILVAADGTVVYHPDPDRILNDNVTQLDSDITLPGERMVAGETGVSTYSFEGTDKYIAYAPILSNGWSIGVMIDQSEIAGQVRELTFGIISMFVVGTLVLVLLIALITRSTLKRVPYLLQNIQTLSEGDFTVAMEDLSSDEIGQIADAFNTVSGNLKHVFTTVIQSSEKLYQSSEGLVDISEESTKALSEISTTINEITEGTASQARDTESTSGEVKVLAQEIEKVLKNADAIYEKTEDAFETSQRGANTIQALTQYSHDSMTSIQSIKAISADMDKSSNEISSIVDTINQISEQTNLLALNASIEAARAGEAGKGFAVVAEEIRKLAEQTSGSTESIRSQIMTIQEKSKHAVEETESSEQIVKNNEAIVQETRAAFEQISTRLSELIDITEMTKEDGLIMSRKKDEIVGLVSSITATAQQVSAGTEEMSASTEEQLASIELLASYTRDLRDIAKVLQDELRAFKIE
ncbi:methyl-accepting chemotaxis protein [Fusibacter sp. JL298sf-3]